MKSYFQRISYQGNIVRLFEKICEDYSLGKYVSHSFLQFGYEDFNVVLQTSTGRYFAKIFGAFRSLEECKRYVSVLKKVTQAGISFPRLYKSFQGYLHQIRLDNATLYLFVSEYIEGKNYFELEMSPTKEDISFFIKQAAAINKLDLKPSFWYDDWAIVNIAEEFIKKKDYVEDEGLKEKVQNIVTQFKTINLKKLPHCFVHGDIIKTNVLKGQSGKRFVIDFGCCNYYPRIVELSAFVCGFCFDEKNPESFQDMYQFAVCEYQRYIKLTEEELELLPLFVKADFASYFLAAHYEKEAHKNTSLENKHWIEVGKQGILVRFP